SRPASRPTSRSRSSRRSPLPSWRTSVAPGSPSSGSPPRRGARGGRPEIHLGSGPDRGLYRSMAARAACRGRQSRRDKRDTHDTPGGLWRWEVGAARSAIVMAARPPARKAACNPRQLFALAVAPTSRAYRACRAGFASRGTPVARGTTPSRSRLAPTRDMSLGSRRRLRLIEALRVLEVRAEELRHRAALEAVHEPVIEGHAERHDRTRDDPSVLDHGPLLHLSDEDDERRAAERHERRIRVREAERPDVGHHRAAEFVLDDPEARQVEVQVVHEVADEA